MRTATLLLASLALAAAPATAAVIATDSFDYANGSIEGQAGGTGWNNEFVDEVGAPPQAPSDWDVVFGSAPNVVSNALVTSDNGAKREFGGAGEGVGEPSNEREGAFRGTGSVFISVSYRVDNLLPADSMQWGGLSSYDFSSERLFWGMTGQWGETRYFAVEISGVATALSPIPVAANTTYNLLAALDFDNDLVALWVNPDGTDTAASYDVSLPYTGTNWATAVRLASGSGASTTWDNVRIATTFAEAVPEPAATLLAGLGLLGLARRRRS